MIRVENLTKYYNHTPALRGISFSVAKGEVVGLLGLNGAGKSTCIRILTGYLFPSEGETFINDVSVFTDPLSLKKSLGYLPETPPLYPELSVEDYLHFVARLRGVPEEEFDEEMKRVAALTQIEGVLRTLIRNLSLGFRKRTGIAQALIGSPPVLIFDEPISGLDPVQIAGIRSLIRELSGKHTILISSHILTEVSRTCDRVIVIHQGRLLGEITGEDLHSHLEEKFIEMVGKRE